jgi:valyl-tRNA synthetase
MQDERYAKYVGKLAIVPLTFGRHVPIIADRVGINITCNICMILITKKVCCNTDQSKAIQQYRIH